MPTQGVTVVVSPTCVLRPRVARKSHEKSPHIRSQSRGASRRFQSRQSVAATAAPPTAPLPSLAPAPAPALHAHNEVSGACKAPPAPLFGDALMETSRPHLRMDFGFENWERLRGTDRYFRHILSTHKSRILLGMVGPLAYVAGVTLAACACGAAHQAGLLPLPAVLSGLGSQLKELFGLTSFALSLLLVFRTNSSYSRWEEAVKASFQVLNRTRGLCRLALTWISDDKRELRDMMCRWAPAYSKVLMCHLRRGEDLRGELEGILRPHEVEGLLHARHRPSYVLQVLAHAVRAARLPSRAALRLQDSLASLEDSLANCERLLDTPIPTFYTRHTTRFLTFWLTGLPFALWPTCGLTTPLLTLLIAFLVLGIEKIGVSIEEPFSILPLEAIARTALTDVRELVAMHGSAANSLPVRRAAEGSPAGSTGSSRCTLGGAVLPAVAPGTAMHSSCDDDRMHSSCDNDRSERIGCIIIRSSASVIKIILPGAAAPHSRGWSASQTPALSGSAAS